jgi:hypothetical protein
VNNKANLHIANGNVNLDENYQHKLPKRGQNMQK